MDGKSLIGIGLLLLLLVVAAANPGKNAEKSKKLKHKAAQTVASDGWICDKSGCRYVGVPTHYACSCHPQVQSPTPGRCPICLMALTPTADTLPQSQPQPQPGQINVRA